MHGSPKTSKFTARTSLHSRKMEPHTGTYAKHRQIIPSTKHTTLSPSLNDNREPPTEKTRYETEVSALKVTKEMGLRTKREER